MYYSYLLCIVMSLIFDVGKTRGSHSPISLINMYSYEKADFDFCVSGLRGMFRNATPWIIENRLVGFFWCRS